MVKISLEDASEPLDEATVERRSNYRAKAEAELREVRARRLRMLGARTDAIERAMTSYSELPSSPETVAFRPGFIARGGPRRMAPSAGGALSRESETLASRRRTERQSRPPATELIAKRSRALPTAATMLYVSQCDADARGRVRARHSIAMNYGGPSWARLCGRSDPDARLRRTRMRRDLDHMAEVGIVRLEPEGQGRYEAFELGREDGTDGRYRVPSPSEAPLLMPASLFTNGWHLVLEPDELALYLALNHQHATAPAAAGAAAMALDSRTRFTTYGVSSEAYNAIHELAEFGLVAITDPMPHRRRGKVRPPTEKELEAAAEAEQSLAPVPYLLELVPGALERPALDVVPESLKTYSLPPRVMEFDEIFAAKYASVPLAAPLKGAARLGAPTASAGPAAGVPAGR